MPFSDTSLSILLRWQVKHVAPARFDENDMGDWGILADAPTVLLPLVNGGKEWCFALH